MPKFINGASLQLVQQKKYNAVCLLHQPCNSKVIYSGSTGSEKTYATFLLVLF